MPESLADRLHDLLAGKNATVGSSDTVPIIPTNNQGGATPGAPPLPKPQPPITGNAYCNLHASPNRVSVLGVKVDLNTCLHCAEIAGPYEPLFQAAVNRYQQAGLTPAALTDARTRLKLLLMALACSESTMNPAAFAQVEGTKVAYGMMQIYHTNLHAYGLTPASAASAAPADIQRNINAGADILLDNLKYYKTNPSHPNQPGSYIADAIAAYKGFAMRYHGPINWTGTLGGKHPIKRTTVVLDVLSCYAKYTGTLGTPTTTGV